MAHWIAYEQLDEERRAVQIARAITMAFKVERKPQASGMDDEDGPVIDTTTPEFRENFKGFINTPVKSPQRGFAGRNTNTEIRMG